MARNQTFTVMTKLKGLKPLLMDQMPPNDVVNVLIRRQRKAPQTDLELAEMAAPKIYRDDEDGAIIVPERMLIASLKYAGKFVKLDARRKVTDAKGASAIFAFLTIMDDRIMLLNGDGVPATDDDWKEQVDKGRLKDGTACGIVRPAFKDWAIELTLEVDLTDADGMTMEKVKDLFKRAGRRAGLGAFRPNCGGAYGQFVVEEWELIDDAQSVAA
jgi:hypothetical protein